jgi:hypothetical protein
MAILFFAIGIPLLNTTSFLLDRAGKKSRLNSLIEKPFNFLLFDQYKFFSPNISDGYILLATTLPDEKILPIKANTGEFVNRLHGVYHAIDMQRETAGALMHSLAVYVLSNYPGTHAIDLKLLEYKLPKLSEYEDDKIGYQLVYENTYSY